MLSVSLKADVMHHEIRSTFTRSRMGESRREWRARDPADRNRGAYGPTPEMKVRGREGRDEQDANQCTEFVSKN